MKTNKGALVVLSAPSGCGKDTVFKELQKIRNDCIESISATTRNPRDGEVDGVNYYFKSKEEFESMIDNNQLLEFAKYNNRYYGTPIEGVEKAVNDGKICFLIIDVKGAKNIMKMYPNCISVFLQPPSLDVLRHRLEKRCTDTKEMIENRLKIAEEEIKYSNLYKYQIVNDALEDAVDKLNKIINKECNTQE